MFAGLDGMATSAGIVASVVGANMSVAVILATGFGKLIGDATSMAACSFTSEWAEGKHIQGERKREMWEMENYPEGEKQEMTEIYAQKGFSSEEASRIVHLMTKHKSYYPYFVDHMMVHELGLQVPPTEEDNPLKESINNGIVSFLAFVIFGSLPLWPYVGFYVANYDDGSYARIWSMFGVCIAVTLFFLFVLGAMLAKMARQNILKNGFLMMFNGFMAAAAAYFIGLGLQRAFNITGC